MDAVDHKIVRVLQDDGRISLTDLAEELPLSVSATRERLRRLEDSNVIAGFTVRINPAAVGRPIEAMIDVRLSPDMDIEDVDAGVRGLDPVVNAIHVTGRFDMELHVLATSVAEVDDLLGRLKDEIGALETNTRLILRTIGGFPRHLPVG